MELMNTLQTVPLRVKGLLHPQRSYMQVGVMGREIARIYKEHGTLYLVNGGLLCDIIHHADHICLREKRGKSAVRNRALFCTLSRSVSKASLWLTDKGLV